MSLVAGLLWPGLFSSKLSKLKAAEKYSGSATLVKLVAKFAACGVDTGGKFTAGVVNTTSNFATGVNFAAGVVDTCGKIFHRCR